MSCWIPFRFLFQRKPNCLFLSKVGSPSFSVVFSPQQKLHSMPLKFSSLDFKEDVIDLTKSASLYIHWPYCTKRCTYCDFNKYVQSSIDHKRMTSCLVTEAKTLLTLSGVEAVTSVYFGGGTPSLAEPHTVQKILEAVQSVVHFPDKTEITLEANPTALETSKLRDFRSAGINRLSVGVQSLTDNDLWLLGRNHSAAEAVSCVKKAIELFHGRVSIDLIFGRPGQTLRECMGELSEALKFCDDHLSLYQLTVKQGTPLFKQVSSNQMTLPDMDTLASMYEACVDLLESESFVRYEVSNFARNGAESIHNKSYWEGKQYIGIGPGAHGRFVCKNNKSLSNSKKLQLREARVQTLEPRQWMSEVESFGHGTRKRVSLSLQEMLEEALVMSLRTVQGINCCVWKQRTDLDLKEILSKSQRFEELIQQNLIYFSGDWLKATKQGINILDSILPDLLNSIEEYCKMQKVIEKN